MSLTLPPPPDKYSQTDQAQMRRTLEKEDGNSFKKGGDVEVANGRIVLRAPNGTRWYLTVSNAGVVAATAL